MDFVYLVIRVFTIMKNCLELATPGCHWLHVNCSQGTILKCSYIAGHICLVQYIVLIMFKHIYYVSVDDAEYLVAAPESGGSTQLRRISSWLLKWCTFLVGL